MRQDSEETGRFVWINEAKRLQSSMQSRGQNSGFEQGVIFFCVKYELSQSGAEKNRESYIDVILSLLSMKNSALFSVRIRQNTCTMQKKVLFTVSDIL